MKAAFLPDRGVVKVSGDDARNFLNGLVTTDVTLVRAGPWPVRRAADAARQDHVRFPYYRSAGRLRRRLSDRLPVAAGAIARDKLGFYKLRAKVTVDNISDTLGVLAAWDGEPAMKPDLTFADPRSDKLGWRILVPEELAARVADVIRADLVESADYEAHRIAAGVPRGGLDFMFGDAFPHEANMDRLHGVDFDKGCYVGQEVVSRMEHRGTARTRIVRVILDDGAPEAGTAVVAADKSVGTMGSSAAGHGLALLRLDRAADALEAGIPLIAGGIPIRLTEPDDLKLLPKKTVA